MGDGKSWIKEGTYIGQDKQQWPLRTGKSSVCNKFAADVQSEDKKDSTNADGSQFQNRTSRNKVFGRNVARIIFGWIFNKSNHRTVQKEVQQTKGRVWDILNAGPRHRFTVEGLLVSNCLILDFVGNSGKHKLMTTADILGGNVSDEVVQAATDMARKSGKPVRMADLIEEEEKRAEEKKKRELEEVARKAKLRAKASFKTQNINPFDAFQIKPVAARGWDKGRTLSEGQKRVLRETMGLNPDAYQYHEAKQILDKQFDIWKKAKEGGYHACTLKMINRLRKYNIDATAMPIEKGKACLDAIAKNNWQLPKNFIVPGSVKIPPRPAPSATEAFVGDVPF